MGNPELEVLPVVSAGKLVFLERKVYFIGITLLNCQDTSL